MFPLWSILGLLDSFLTFIMSFFKPHESHRTPKSPVEPTDSGYETNSPALANGRKKRSAFGKQRGLRPAGILNL